MARGLDGKLFSIRRAMVILVIAFLIGNQVTVLSRSIPQAQKPVQNKATPDFDQKKTPLGPSEVVIKYWEFSEKGEIAEAGKYVKGAYHKRWQELIRKQKNRKHVPRDSDLARKDPVEPLLKTNFPRIIFETKMELRKIENEEINGDEAKVTVVVGYKSRTHSWMIDFFLIEDESDWKISDSREKIDNKQAKPKSKKPIARV